MAKKTKERLKMWHKWYIYSCHSVIEKHIETIWGFEQKTTLKVSMQNPSTDHATSGITVGYIYIYS